MALQSADKKVQEICDVLREETLKPAKKEAQRYLEQARWEADEIIKKAKEEAERIAKENQKKLDKDFKIHESSLQLAIKQAVQKLKQSIEAVFSREWQAMLGRKLQSEDVVAKLINTLVNAVEKDGLKTDLIAVIPKEISKEAIVAALQENVKKRITKEKIILGEIRGGAELKLVEEKMVIAMSDQAIIELLRQYVTETLKEKMFTPST